MNRVCGLPCKRTAAQIFKVSEHVFSKPATFYPIHIIKHFSAELTIKKGECLRNKKNNDNNAYLPEEISKNCRYEIANC